MVARAPGPPSPDPPPSPVPHAPPSPAPLVCRFGPYLGATAAALVYNYLLAYQPETHPVPANSGSDAPASAPAPAAVEAKEAPALEAVAVTGGAPAASAKSDLAAWN